MSTEIAARSPLQELVQQVRGEAFLEQVKLALPGNVRPERFQRAVITAIMQNPEVVVDPPSLFQAAIRAAQDGLIPDNKEAAFVVVKEKGAKKVAYWPMIGGYRKIAAKHGFTIVADVVRVNDLFAWTKIPPAIEHRPSSDPGSEILCAYAAAFDKDWRFVAAPIVMTVAEIEKVRAVSRAGQSEYGPWVQWWERMACKTVARRLFHELPLGDLEEIDQRIVQAADDEADLVPSSRLTADEADIVATLANASPPEDGGPDDRTPDGPTPQSPGAAAVSESDAAGPPAASHIDEGEWQEATELSPEIIELAGQEKIPSGVHKGRTLAEVAADPSHQQWIATQLKRLPLDDAFRPAIECFAEGALPAIWQSYIEWRA